MPVDDATTSALKRRLLAQREGPCSPTKEVPAAFAKRATSRLREEQQQPGPRRATLRASPGVVARVKAATAVRRVERALEDADARARREFEPNRRGDADAWRRIRAARLRGDLARGYALSADRGRADALLGDATALLADLLEDQRRRRAEAAAVARRDALLARMAPPDPVPSWHVDVRDYVARTRASVDEYEASLAADPTRAASARAYFDQFPNKDR